jgi:N-acetylneuraminic acid mutarotase
VVDDYIYLGLGYTGPIHRDTAYMRDFWAYAPSTNTWKRLADFPSNTTVKNCLFVTGDEIFAVYGFYRQFTQDVYRYEIQNDQWKKVEFKSSLNIPRAMDVVGATCQGRHFVGTGFNHGSLRFWTEWDPIQHQWIARKKILGAGRNAAACCATDDYIYLVGGRHYGDSLTTGFFYNSIQRYSPSQDKWEYIGCIPYEAENMVSVSVRNQIFIGLGENPDGEIQNYWYRIEE